MKRIKKRISSENEGKLVIRESCAHAALTGCPNLIQYFSCWLDDGHLHIQTEYCDRGSMDCFVSQEKDKDHEREKGDDKGKSPRKMSSSSSSSAPFSFSISASGSQSTSTSNSSSAQKLRSRERVTSMGSTASTATATSYSAATALALESTPVSRADIDIADSHLHSFSASKDTDTVDEVFMESSDSGPSPMRQQSRFSEAMQSLGEDSQNSDSYSCFSENNSGQSYQDNFERRDKIIESFQINEDENEEASIGFEPFEVEKKEEIPSVRAGKMSETLAWMVLKSLADALHFMHQRGIQIDKYALQILPYLNYFFTIRIASNKVYENRIITT